MTYQNYQFTAYTEADLLQGKNGSSIGSGDKFTMPGSASVTMSTSDNGRYLSGDDDDQALDSTGQEAHVDGQRVGGKMYAEKYHVLYGSDGKKYYLIEIEIEDYDAPGKGDDFFSFYGDIPSAGVELYVSHSCNVRGNWVDYKCLTAGDAAPSNTPPTFTNLPENGVFCIDENTTLVIDINSDDADGDAVTYEIVGGRDKDFFEIDASTGELTFVAPPDYENPQSGGNNNTYDVTVKVSDGKGGHDVKALWVKVKDVDEPAPKPGNCIVIEAEDMHLSGYRVEHRDAASGGENIKLSDYKGFATTNFDGPAGTYDLNLSYLDENDGQGFIDIFINGTFVYCIELNQDTDGGGWAGSSSAFSVATVQDLVLNPGDEIKIKGRKDGCEYARIDKIELCQDGQPCPEDFLKLDFEGLDKGDIVDTQVPGVTITAARDGDAGTNAAMIFDSDHPTGGDHDLEYDGRGNILIISEDDDSSDPDDNAGGGVICFDFDQPSAVHDIVLLDIEENGGKIELFDASGALIKTVAIPSAGDNSAQTIFLDAEDVTSMKVTLVGSGAVDDLCWKPGEAPQPGAIEGRIFCDDNDDSVDNAEPGVGGVLVTLLDSTGAVVDTTTTAADGSYLFDNLPAGDYSVLFPTEVDGKVLVEADVGGDDTIDSDADQNTGETGAVTVIAGQTTSDVDAGVEDPGTASVAGRYFCDENDDDVDNAEPGVGGVTVSLLQGSAVIATTTTAADGSYSFTGLDAGEYSVLFAAEPTGKVFVAQDAGGDDTVDSDVDPATGQTAPFSLALGENKEDVDAGVEDPETASISGRYFCDDNGDDIDNAEPGVGGVTVSLVQGGTVVGTTVTASDGSYSFSNLDAGDYAVLFAAEPTGKAFVAQDVGSDDTVDSDVDPATGQTATFSLALGENKTDVDAGVVDPGTASIAGRIFCDENDNSVDDAEPGVGGVTVTLLSGGLVVGTTVTEADGSYIFENLDAGDYVVDFPTDVDGKILVDANVGGNDTVDSDANQGTGETGVITLNIGDAVTDVDAGIEDPGTAEIGDRVFIDANGNGVQDAGEVGLDGVTVTLRDSTGNTRTVVTAGGGLYLFDNLDAGDYTVDFSEPDGFDFTAQDIGDDAFDSDADPITGETATISLAIGESNLTIDAGVISEDPTLLDDMGKTCADEAIMIDVLANDTDGPGQVLTITEVDGQAITEGVSITTAIGTVVTLSGGKLVFDGETAYQSLDIGEEAIETISYTVSDGLGGEAMADVDVTFCGVAETLEELFASLPQSTTYKIAATDAESPIEPDAFTIEMSNTGDARFDGVVFEQAYCLSLLDPADGAELLTNAPTLTGDVLDGKDSSVLAGRSSFATGGSAVDNLGYINWILNEDFESNGAGSVDGQFTGWEIQRAIWEFTDQFDTDYLSNFDAGYGDDADVDFIVNAALADPANANFMSGPGGIASLIIDPNPATSTNSQPFIVAFGFDDNDCLC
ncbi:MAG: SdrD B-like domain-containing protein [Pseudomonadota bacterium]